MKKYLFGLVLALASTSVLADSLLYGGASVGQSRYKGENGTSYDVHVGTGILPFIGIEGGMTRFDGLDTAPGQETEMTTTYLAIRPSINVGPMQLYSRVGVHTWDEKINGAKTDDGIDILYGVGFNYNIIDTITIGASYQRYVMDSDDMGTFMLNASFNFM